MFEYLIWKIFQYQEDTIKTFNSEMLKTLTSDNLKKAPDRQLLLDKLTGYKSSELGAVISSYENLEHDYKIGCQLTQLQIDMLKLLYEDFKNNHKQPEEQIKVALIEGNIVEL